jgi:hypothetical protein
MTTRLLRVLTQKVPGFEFNSLRRWLSIPDSLEQLIGDATLVESAGNDAEPVELTGFGDLETSPRDYSR